MQSVWQIETSFAQVEVDFSFPLVANIFSVFHWLQIFDLSFPLIANILSVFHWLKIFEAAGG